MQERYRLVVWGPGGLGKVAIWEAARLPELELVGVRAYSKRKVGRDAGDLVGIDPIGVAATDDIAALLAVECDAVIFTPADFGNHNTDEELLMLLTAGKNVITPLPYQNAHLFRDDDFVKRLVEACRVGGSTFHATGIDPDVVSDRVLLGLTDMCSDVRRIRLREMWDVNHVGKVGLANVGFGHPREVVKESAAVAGVASDFLHAIVRTAEETLGVSYDRVVEKHEGFVTDADIHLTHTTLRAGTVGRLVHSMEGWVDDISTSEPFFTIEYNWVAGDTMLPEGVQPNQYWIAEIEGTPSLRMVVDLRTSLDSDERLYAYGSMLSSPGYHGTIAPCLHALPEVVAAAPGVLPTRGPGSHWVRDLRSTAGVTPAPAS